MAFATASSAANRKPDDNTQTAAPPQAQARPRQSPGKAEPPPYARQSPQHAPEPASAHQAPSACQAPQHARARQRMPDPRRVPEPRACRDENLVGSPPAMFWRAEPPARAGTKTGLWSVSRADHRTSKR